MDPLRRSQMSLPPSGELSPSYKTALDEHGEIAAGKKISLYAGGLRRLDVRGLVSDQKAFCPINRPVAHQVEQHAGFRLAPVGIPAIGGDLALRVKGAIAHVVDARALRREFGPHPSVE